jgi:hypothetical protein
MFLNENYQNEEEVVLEHEVEADDSISEATEASMFEIVMESQQELHNLQMSMIRLEHTAVISEDTALLEAGVKEYFTKAIEWLKKAWTSIKSWFVALFKKIQVMFSSTKTLVDKYGSKLGSLKLDGLKLSAYEKFESVDGDAFLKAAAEINGESKKVTAKMGDKQISQDAFRVIFMKHFSVAGSKAKGISGALEASILGTQKEVTVDQKRVNAYTNTIKVGSAVIGRLQSFQKLVDATYNHGIAAANKGLSASDDEQDLYRKQCTADQNAASVMGQIVSGYTAVYTKHFNEAVRVIKAALAHDAKGSKAPEAAPVADDKKKVEDKKKSEDSVLSQFGF